MRILIIVLILAHIISYSHAQKGPDSIIIYNRFVNQAELMIIDSNLNSAMNYYDSAFSSKRFPFAKDIWNASICANTLKEYNKVSSLFIRLLDKGLSIEYLNKKEVFTNYFSSELSHDLAKYCNDLTVKINLKYRHLLDSLIFMDQLFRKKENAYLIFLDTIAKIDKSNINYFNDLILKYGFPTEENIGLDEKMFALPVYYLIINHQQAGSLTRCTDFTILLKDAISRGDIDLHYGIDLLEGVDGSNYFGTQNFCLIKCRLEDSVDTTNEHQRRETNEYGYEKLNPDTIQKINIRRIKVGLETRDDYFKKLLFSNKNYIFGSGTSFRTYYWSNYKDYYSARDKLIYIK